MIPYDGGGFGRSIYWQYQAKNIAKKKNEFCPCWWDTNVSLKFSSDGLYTVNVGCNPKRVTCRSDFTRTDKSITKMFKKFYIDG